MKFKLFSRLFSPKTNKAWQGLDARIVPAFKLDGKQYYKFDDAFAMGNQRAFATMDFYHEVQMRCSREFLEAHVNAIENVLKDSDQQFKSKDGTLDLTALMKMINTVKGYNHQLKERLDFIIEQDTLYKLASVMFFDESENPMTYDYRYNLETKIPAFRKSGMDFFLSMPVKELMPFGSMSDGDFETYLTTQKKVTEYHLESLSSQLSTDFKNSEHYKNLRSLMNLAFPDQN